MSGCCLRTQRSRPQNHRPRHTSPSHPSGFFPSPGGPRQPELAQQRTPNRGKTKIQPHESARPARLPRRQTPACAHPNWPDHQDFRRLGVRADDHGQRVKTRSLEASRRRPNFRGAGANIAHYREAHFVDVVIRVGHFENLASPKLLATRAPSRCAPAWRTTPHFPPAQVFRS